MGIMIFMLKSQRRAFRWPNDLCARLYMSDYTYMVVTGFSGSFKYYNWLMTVEYQ